MQNRRIWPLISPGVVERRPTIVEIACSLGIEAIVERNRSTAIFPTASSVSSDEITSCPRTSSIRLRSVTPRCTIFSLSSTDTIFQNQSAFTHASLLSLFSIPTASDSPSVFSSRRTRNSSSRYNSCCFADPSTNRPTTPTSTPSFSFSFRSKSSCSIRRSDGVSRSCRLFCRNRATFACDAIDGRVDSCEGRIERRNVTPSANTTSRSSLIVAFPVSSNSFFISNSFARLSFLPFPTSLPSHSTENSCQYTHRLRVFFISESTNIFSAGVCTHSFANERPSASMSAFPSSIIFGARFVIAAKPVSVSSIDWNRY
ncbi:hypothetical protein BLNAU_10176 [Blattamonas nauphoetae]|uniref:Uncharacterized protein n=1 Tax=Blattamonas nauphoetae TaxID=2049346 RepID=A0ABQ9XTP2_9EUKA|nr:hypothetical protein BLNAU_10176 [Blattamonas nauphoetae]